MKISFILGSIFPLSGRDTNRSPGMFLIVYLSSIKVHLNWDLLVIYFAHNMNRQWIRWTKDFLFFHSPLGFVSRLSPSPLLHLHLFHNFLLQENQVSQPFKNIYGWHSACTSLVSTKFKGTIPSKMLSTISRMLIGEGCFSKTSDILKASILGNWLSDFVRIRGCS